MQPLNDAQLAEHTAILGKVKLDKGLDYETIGKMLIASVLLETKRASTHRSRMSKAVFRLRPDPALDQVPHRRPGSESGLVRL